jgi:hypothetical protein
LEPTLPFFQWIRHERNPVRCEELEGVKEQLRFQFSIVILKILEARSAGVIKADDFPVEKCRFDVQPLNRVDNSFEAFR